MELQEWFTDQVPGDVEDAGRAIAAGRRAQAARHRVEQRLAHADDRPDARGDVVDPGQVLRVGEGLKPGAQGVDETWPAR